MTVKELLVQRGLRLDAMGIITGKDKATISRIANGKSRARPETVVAMSRALGISARRMQAICDASWDAAHPDEVLTA